MMLMICTICLALLFCYFIDLITVFILFLCIYTMLLVYCAARSFWIWLIIWCLGIDTNLIAPEEKAFREAPLAGEYGWGPGNLVAVPDDGGPLEGWATFILGFKSHSYQDLGMIMDMYKYIILPFWH